MVVERMEIQVYIPSQLEFDILNPYIKDIAMLKSIHSGVGTASIQFQCSKSFILNKPDLAILVGIAGSFNEKLTTNSLVNVQQECFADIGIFLNDTFIGQHKLNYLKPNMDIDNNGFIIPKYTINESFINIPKVTGASINLVYREEKYLNALQSFWNCDIQNMEGAAFFSICNIYNIPCVEIRGISNLVSDFNKEKWDIENTLHRLGQYLRSEITNYIQKKNKK